MESIAHLNLAHGVCLHERVHKLSKMIFYWRQVGVNGVRPPVTRVL